MISKDNDAIVIEKAEPEFRNVNEAFCDVAPTIRTLVKECDCMISRALSLEMERYYSVSKVSDKIDHATGIWIYTRKDPSPVPGLFNSYIFFVKVASTTF